MKFIVVSAAHFHAFFLLKEYVLERVHTQDVPLCFSRLNSVTEFLSTGESLVLEKRAKRQGEGLDSGVEGGW